jgi:polysaccharide export outer membrane protein
MIEQVNVLAGGFIRRTSFQFICFLILVLVSSCSPRNLVYFSDLDNYSDYKNKITNKTEPRIQPDDLLSISVSSLSPETNLLFNSGVVPANGGVTSLSATSPTVTNRINEGYLVNSKGMINFPVIGEIAIAGLTKEEAREKISTETKKYVKDPIVNIRFINFRITVIGEVNHPSTFTIPTEKINVLEALGLAGDMTAYGKRENVLIIREKEGVRSATRINLNQKDVLSNPYFYLQQNDIVYVEPHKAKALQASARNSYLPLIVSISSVIVLVLSRLFY